MKTLHRWSTILVLVIAVSLVGCDTSTKSPEVAGSIRTSLDHAGLKDVSVNQDRDKGVVTLGGHVPAEDAKSQAESIARSMAGGQVVANQIAVVPPGNESVAKTVNADLDKGIEKNLDAVLVANHFDKAVKYDVKNLVVTLTGDVDSQAKRTQVERMAGSVPNVQQVVNEVQVKNQKATTSR